MSAPARGAAEDRPPHPASPGPAETARELARALAGMTYVPIRRAELEQRFRDIVAGLAAALDAEPPPVPGEAGAAAGAALVAAHVTDPAVAGQAMEIIGARLLADLGIDGPEPRLRLAALVGGMAGGYARALRDRTLA
ncbi:MAG TPA: hypothetical protein VGJ54_07900, partial [Streptosporangiaceae bacterium]